MESEATTAEPLNDFNSPYLDEQSKLLNSAVMNAAEETETNMDQYTDNDTQGKLAFQISKQRLPMASEATNAEPLNDFNSPYLDEQSKLLTNAVMNAAEETETNVDQSTDNSTQGKLAVQVITKYMCRYCARQFDSPGDMQAHIATHGRGKASAQCHSCYVCGKTYSTPSKLQRHVRVHSGERPYACNICGRRFTRSDHVKQHLKVHLPQKQRNTCRVCGMKFLRRQTLHSHLQQSHGVSQVYTCHRCGEAFDRVEKLHQHKNSHLNADVQTEVPMALEGGLVIKRESNDAKVDDATNYVVGLAKFSLGPQPQVNEDGTSILNDYVSQEEIRESIHAHENYGIDIGDNSMDTSDNGIVMNPQSNMAISSCYSLAANYNVSNTKSQNSNEEETSTVTDGQQMFILTPDIKQEKPDDGEYGKTSSLTPYPDTDGKREITPSENGNTVKKESHDQCEQVNFDSDDSSTKESPPQKTQKVSPLTVKLGPASYKAAMRNKILMNFPGSRNQPLRTQDKTLLGYTNLNKAPSNSIFLPKPKTKSPALTTAIVPYGKKLSRCEHCCIWFEDYTMCLLHNSLHSADDSDPFTCRKCLKKLGNRLEFTAHLVWHLEPDMEG